MPYTPESLTVVLVSYNASRTIGRALDALARQTVRGFETLVVDSSDDGGEKRIAAEHPRVRFHHVAGRHYPGKARNVAMKLTDRRLIAYVDADCLADPDWVDQILRAHNDPANLDQWIVGGSVGVANNESAVGWASFFCEFSPWLRGGVPRRVKDIPTCCYSMKREAFEACGPFDEEGYCSDTIFNWKAGRKGQAPLLIPAMHVRHINPTDLRAIAAKQGLHGERFATIRAREHQWSRARALASAATAPVLPAVLWFRAGRRALRAPGYRIPFLRSTPAQWRVLARWSAGEARGYWHAAF